MIRAEEEMEEIRIIVKQINEYLNRVESSKQFQNNRDAYLWVRQLDPKMRVALNATIYLYQRCYLTR